ncbi:hypothetical protein BE20_29205 [Sorangium cellulosum]|uniref:Uncharacterized protein n=1 Tax=Sorangium cellulosum TaxID=56 RepID=A0A150S246_SORCE|nr:hypothetical protein BE18_35150 [Sorangium cellulosum]KYF86396.1 hypothetical protein BE20_29205 [Sorangium cellulosum]
MSQALVVACSRHVQLDELHEMTKSHFGAQVHAYEDELQVRGGDGYVRISLLGDDAEVAEDYVANEDLDAAFRAEARDKTYVYVVFNDFELVKSVMAVLLRGLGDELPSCWIDTDYGWVMRGAAFLQHLEQDIEWDWRHKA